MNIVQYPGCGAFFQPASFVALDPRSGHLCGICLSSMVADDMGHITQVCVSKAGRVRGVGYELLRRSLDVLAQIHCVRSSVTLSAALRPASPLSAPIGFT